MVGAPDAEPENGKPAIVCLSSGEFVCKIWRMTSDNLILDPENRKHAPIILGKDDVVWAYRVVGAFSAEE